MPYSIDDENMKNVVVSEQKHVDRKPKKGSKSRALFSTVLYIDSTMPLVIPQ